MDRFPHRNLAVTFRTCLASSSAHLRVAQLFPQTTSRHAPGRVARSLATQEHSSSHALSQSPTFVFSGPLPWNCVCSSLYSLAFLWYFYLGVHPALEDSMSTIVIHGEGLGKTHHRGALADCGASDTGEYFKERPAPLRPFRYVRPTRRCRLCEKLPKADVNVVRVALGHAYRRKIPERRRESRGTMFFLRQPRYGGAGSTRAARPGTR